MMSRAVEPIALSARTSSSTLAPCLSTTLRAFFSFVSTLTSGVTMVWPVESGLGCEALKKVWISTVRVPSRITTGEMRTSLPKTMVPVCSLTTIRAGESASTIRSSSSPKIDYPGFVGAGYIHRDERGIL